MTFFRYVLKTTIFILNKTSSKATENFMSCGEENFLVLLFYMFEVVTFFKNIYNQTKFDPKANKWLKTMNSNMEFITKNQV